MKPVDQSIFNFTNGDCFRACIASVLELPLGYVPNFTEPDVEGMWDEANVWLSKFNLKAVCIQFNTPEDTQCLDGLIVLAGGLSPRAIDNNPDHRHSVVWKDGQMIHDPHPDRSGLKGDPEDYTIFAKIDPSKE